MTPEEMKAVLDVHRHAEDTNDLETAIGTYHDDCFYEVVTEGFRVNGKDAIREVYRHVMANVPERPREILAETYGENVAIHWAREWVSLPAGATGLEKDITVQLDGVSVIPFKDGLMEAEIIFTNALTAFMAAGLTIDQIKALHGA